MPMACHWGRFVRTIVEVETDNGLIGLGEMGGGGESAEAVFRAMKNYLAGHDPARLEEMRFLIANPTASLYNNRTQILAALEFACLDILGQAWGVPVSRNPGRAFTRPCALRILSVLSLSESRDWQWGSANNRSPDCAHTRIEGTIWLHHSQAQRRSVSSGLRT